MRIARHLKIRLSVPLTNEDDDHERDEGDDGILVASGYW
jgi:hypothetical protein